jgi:hypothetical protein
VVRDDLVEEATHREPLDRLLDPFERHLDGFVADHVEPVLDTDVSHLVVAEEVRAGLEVNAVHISHLSKSIRVVGGPDHPIPLGGSLSRLAHLMGDQADVDGDGEQPSIVIRRSGELLDRCRTVRQADVEGGCDRQEDADHRPEGHLLVQGGSRLGPLAAVPVGDGVSRPLQDTPGDQSHEDASEGASVVPPGPAVEGGADQDDSEDEPELAIVPGLRLGLGARLGLGGAGGAVEVDARHARILPSRREEVSIAPSI